MSKVAGRRRRSDAMHASDSFLQGIKKELFSLRTKDCLLRCTRGLNGLWLLVWLWDQVWLCIVFYSNDLVIVQAGQMVLMHVWMLLRLVQSLAIMVMAMLHDLEPVVLVNELVVASLELPDVLDAHLYLLRLGELLASRNRQQRLKDGK